MSVCYSHQKASVANEISEWPFERERADECGSSAWRGRGVWVTEREMLCNCCVEMWLCNYSGGGAADGSWRILLCSSFTAVGWTRTEMGLEESRATSLTFF